MAASPEVYLAGGRTSAGGRPPNLPLIKHPMSRLGNQTGLAVRGISRGSCNIDLSGGRLKPLRENTMVTIDRGQVCLGLDRSNLPILSGEPKRHSRIITWPPVHLQKENEQRPATVKSTNLEMAKSLYGPEELFEMVKEKLTTSFQGIRQMFKAHDPQGQGTVSKAALSKIIYHLYGYLSSDQQNKLFHRLGLYNKDTISFDEFISCFRENETVKREWLSPIAKKQLSAEKKKYKHPEANLRKNNFKMDLLKQPVTATLALALLKEQAQLKSFNIQEHLPESCLGREGMLVPPQLREGLALMNIRLDDYEFQKLWDRLDPQNVLAIPTSILFKLMGLNPFNGQRIITKVEKDGEKFIEEYIQMPQMEEDINVESSMDENDINIDEDKIKEDNIVEKTQQRESFSRSSPYKRPETLDIVSWITGKIEEKYRSMASAFEHFDENNDYTVNIYYFRKVLMEYNFPMVATEIEKLVERAGVRLQGSRINYKKFLLNYMNRSEYGLPHKIITDEKHRFNARTFTPPGNLSVGEAEAKLIDYFHSEFLRALETLRSLDKHQLGLITQWQFRRTIEKVFDIKMSDAQFNILLHEIGLTNDGLVPYKEFLWLFNKKRPTSVPLPLKIESQEKAEKIVLNNQQAEATATPTKLIETKQDQLKEEDKEKGKEKEVLIEEKRTYIHARPVKLLEKIVGEILRSKFHSAQKAYHQIDRKFVGRLSKPQFHAWLVSLGETLNLEELNDLWKEMEVGKDGLVHFSEVYHRFALQAKNIPQVKNKGPTEDTKKYVEQVKEIYKSRQEAKVNAFENKPIISHNQRIRHIDSGLLDEILYRIRLQVVNNWEFLKKSFKQTDPNGFAHIRLIEFKVIAERIFSLTPLELDTLARKFDLNFNGRFHYMPFLEMYSVPAPIGANLYDKSTHKLLQKQIGTAGSEHSMTVTDVMIRVRKKLLSEWKNLRRAFRRADNEGKGYLTNKEFRRILLNNKVVVREDDLYHLLAEFDSNMDGRVSYDEFLEQMLSPCFERK